MDTIKILNKEFSAQDFHEMPPCAEMLDRYRLIARNYASMENAIAVLSDLRSNTSYLYYGRFAQTLGMDKGHREEIVSSIWEEEIFGLIHPDDLAEKHRQELCFFHFVKRQPRNKRNDYYLTSKLRIRSRANSYIPILHRMFYIPASVDGSLWLALCLYSPLLFDFQAQCLIVDSSDGQMAELAKQSDIQILSARERQILRLIDRGLRSKEIAQMLSISIHTVSRHRQEILARLQVKNSIEACRLAKEMKLIQ